MADKTVNLAQLVLTLLDSAGIDVDSQGRLRVAAATTSAPQKVRVYNGGAGAFAEGDLLYASGTAATGEVSVDLAVASNDARRAVLVADEAIAAGAYGEAVDWKIVTRNTTGGTIGREWFLDGTTPGAGNRTDPSIASESRISQDVGTILSVGAAGSVLLRPNLHDNKASGRYDSRLQSLGTTRRMGGRDVGRVGTKYLYLTGVAADGQLVTLGTRVYEFDTNAAVTAGNVAVDISGGASANQAITALVAAINADASRVADAVAWAGNDGTSSGMLVVEDSLTGSNIAVSTTCLNGVVGAAATTGAAAIANRDLFALPRTILGADVTALARVNGAAAKIGEIEIMGVPVTSAPTVTVYSLKRPSGSDFGEVSLATVLFRWVQVNANFWVLKCLDPNAVLATNDVLHTIAIS